MIWGLSPLQLLCKTATFLPNSLQRRGLYIIPRFNVLCNCNDITRTIWRNTAMHYAMFDASMAAILHVIGPIHGRRPREAEGTAPTNLRWGTVHASVPPIF